MDTIPEVLPRHLSFDPPTIIIVAPLSNQHEASRTLQVRRQPTDDAEKLGNALMCRQLPDHADKQRRINAVSRSKVSWFRLRGCEQGEIDSVVDQRHPFRINPALEKIIDVSL